MNTTLPRPEHPQPQMERTNWMNLNGEWDFSFDFSDSGLERKLFQKKELDRKILVPFCPESSLSGIDFQDFILAVWYHRTVELTKEQLAGRVLLHFGAVDYESRVWVNGKRAGSHRGGYSSFVLDVTDLVAEGSNDITVYARDDIRSGKQPRGKQVSEYAPHGCVYTRTTGIWQTVWLEFVPKAYIRSVQYYPNVAASTVTIKAVVEGSGTFGAEAFYEGKSCGSVTAGATAGNVLVTLPLSELHLWEAGAGRLYDLKLTFGEDAVGSYFGMREVAIDGEKVRINGKSVFQRLVLDQGFYPDGIYTAPTEEALVRDIELSLAAGFNGARLHEKVFEPRFLYHCDRLGYIVWGEFGNWGFECRLPEGLKLYLPQWLEVVQRDFNHPAIVGWCPFNETNGQQDNDLLAEIYRMTKLVDTTRPCIDTSGYWHVITDIYDRHDYEQDPEKFAAMYEEFKNGGEFKDPHPQVTPYRKGMPVFISEMGGIKWDVEGRTDGWGYGVGPETTEAFFARYQGLMDVLLDNPHICAFCYTQLYDVEQELNGLYTYGRKPKFDVARLKAITERKAAIED